MISDIKGWKPATEIFLNIIDVYEDISAVSFRIPVVRLAITEVMNTFLSKHYDSDCCICSFNGC